MREWERELEKEREREREKERERKREREREREKGRQRDREREREGRGPVAVTRQSSGRAPDGGITATHATGSARRVPAPRPASRCRCSWRERGGGGVARADWSVRIDANPHPNRCESRIHSDSLEFTHTE